MLESFPWRRFNQLPPVRYANGMDAVIVSKAENIILGKSDPNIAKILGHNNIMNGTHIMTVSGQDLGKMVDLYFDETSGAIEGYGVSGGIFADAYSGRSFVPVVQTGFAQLIDWVKQTSNKLRAQTTHAVEAQQIKGALGRPATRVILDRQDRVILNAGELITHQSIEDARHSEMLEVLLSSVYTKTPELSQATLRAPEPGRAALPSVN